MMSNDDCDLLVVGGGPAGLAAAINGASEGLCVRILDGGPNLGGQAKESHAIENYGGFVEAIRGADLMSAFIDQAIKFRTIIECPARAVRLHCEGDWRHVVTDDFRSFRSRVVLLSIGLSYRSHPAQGVSALMNRGVWQGMPSQHHALTTSNTSIVVGGANSAGQAAVRLARNKKARVKVVVRKRIADQMSQYLIDRIRDAENVEVLEGCEVTEVHGKRRLEACTVNGEVVPANYMFVFIGATPHTAWLDGVVRLSPKKFILTGYDARRDGSERVPLPYETSVPGVFAAGDVRDGGGKRISIAAAEGVSALQSSYLYMEELRKKECGNAVV